MSRYKCTRCGYDTNVSTHMRDHLNRLNICEPLLNNIIFTEEMKNDILNTCNFCNKNYKKKSKEDHERSCTKKKEKELITKQNEEIISKLNKLELAMTNNNIHIENQQNIIENNININLQVLGYDSFTTSHIDRKWMIENLVENKNEISNVIVVFFEDVFLNENMTRNHSIFCVDMKKNKTEIYAYTDNRIIKEVSIEEFYNFIEKNVKARFHYLLETKEKMFVVGNYDSLTVDDKKRLSLEDYLEIKEALVDYFNKRGPSEFPEVLDTLKENSTKIEDTLAELHKQKSILMPTKAKNYLEYIGSKYD
jgi:hypothetical protein